MYDFEVAISEPQNVINAIIRSLALDADSLARLVDLNLSQDILLAIRLVEDRQGDIFVVGTGTSGHLAKKLAASLTSISVPTYFLDPTNTKHGDAGYLKHGSLVIFVSKSGNTEELVEFFKLNVGSISTTISIVGERNSFLGRKTTHTVSFGLFPESDPLGIIPSTSALTTMAIFNAIVAGLIVKLNFKNNDFLKNHPKGALGKRLSTRFSDVMQNSINHPSVINETSTLLDGINAISSGRLGACLIVDSEQHLLGVFTDGDLRRFFQSNSSYDLQQPILEVASTNSLVIATPDLLVLPFIEKMEHAKRVLVIPVVTDNRLVGITHIHDVITHTVGD